MSTIDPRLYQAIVLAKALEVYAQTGVKVNRLYTPANMVQTAQKITGKVFKRRDYLGAAQALRAWADQQTGL